jgi:hypothetical protein
MVDEIGGAWKRTEMHTKFWCESSEERYHVEDLGIYGMIILKGDVKEIVRTCAE